MRRFRFDPSAGAPVTAHASRAVRAGPVQSTPALLVVTAIGIEPGGEVGEHEAPVDRLVLVVAGEGWLSGGAGDPVATRAGEAAFFRAGERHRLGSRAGLQAIVLEGEGLDPDAHLEAVDDG